MKKLFLAAIVMVIIFSIAYTVFLKNGVDQWDAAAFATFATALAALAAFAASQLLSFWMAPAIQRRKKSWLSPVFWR